MFAFLAPLLLRFAGVGNLFKSGSAQLAKVPPQVWQALAVLGYALALYATHQRAVHDHDTAIIAANNAQWQTRLNAAHSDALAWKAKADQQAMTIAQNERTKHEEDIRLNAAAADALLLRGPGAASAAHCGQVNHPGTPAAPDRHDQAAPQAGAPATQVPSGDWALVPWNWLVGVLHEHDDLLSDVTTVISNDEKQRAAWPQQPVPSR